MRNFNIIHYFLLLSVICMVSCSTNGFMVRKNHQPRVRIEKQSLIETTKVLPAKVEVSSSREKSQKINSVQDDKGLGVSKPPFFQKVLVAFYPHQKKMINKVFEFRKHQLKPARLEEGEDRTTGLIINLLALAFGIAALFMVIGVAHGNLWVYFVVGLILAAAAIIMGMIGKGMAWKGFGWLAGIIGIVAVVLLLIFMVLVAVVHTTF